jgi:hypothetical protein
VVLVVELVVRAAQALVQLGQLIKDLPEVALAAQEAISHPQVAVERVASEATTRD